MLLRISLIVAILAGIGATVLNFVHVRERLVTTMNERDTEKSDKEKAQGELKTTQNNLKKTQTELTSTKSALSTAQTNLQIKTETIASLEKRGAELVAQVDKTKAERDAAQQKLTAWDVLGLTVDQVRGVQADLKKTIEEREALTGENKVLFQKKNQLEARLARYEGDVDKVPPLPIGLKGKVVAVDPKYDFVVLDIGGDQGVLERGEMLVNRNGRLIAKVKITTVQPNRSIANVLPAWKHADIMEGDQVLY
jgi:multidrug efflux pump subunit AcrA (membrane-fusion protein)